MRNLLKNLREYPLFQNDDFVRRVIALSVPIMAQQMLVAMVNLVDNLMVGQLGEQAMSAVALANKFFIIALFAINGVAVSASVYMSQFYGAKEYSELQQSYRFSLITSLAISLFFVIPGILFPVQIGSFFVKDASLHPFLQDYMPIAALSYLPQVYSLNTQNAMRTLGETKKPLMLSFLAVVSNVFFNYLLIFGKLGLPALGVKGAAIGTLLARFVELIACRLVLMHNDFPFGGRVKDVFKIAPPIAQAISLKALPLVLNEIGYASGMALLLKFYGTRGRDVIASMTIMLTTSELFFVLFGGLAVATTVVVGHELGSNNLEKARSNAYRLYKLGILLCSFFALLMFVFSFFVPDLYDVSDKVKAMSGFFLRIYSIFYVFYIVNSMAYQILRAGGDMKLTMAVDAGFFWLINVPVVGIAAYFTDWSVYLMFILGQFTDFLKIFLSGHLLSRETWLRNLTKDVKKE